MHTQKIRSVLYMALLKGGRHFMDKMRILFFKGVYGIQLRTSMRVALSEKCCDGRRKFGA